MGGFSALPALDIKPPENPLDQYAKALSVKSMLGGEQLQQQKIQSGQMDLQMKQLELKNMQTVQSAMSDPKLEDQFADWQKSKKSAATSATPTAASNTEPIPNATGETPSPEPIPNADIGMSLHPLAQFLAEKKGLPLLGPGGAMEVSANLVKSSQEMANLIKTKGDVTKTALENHSKQVDNLLERAEPVFTETDPTKQSTELGRLKNDVLMNSANYPAEAVKRIQGVNTIGDLAALTNYGKMHQMLIEEGTKAAEEQSAKATAIQKTQAASGIKDAHGFYTPQAQAAINTVSTYTAIPQNMRVALTQEMKNAPDWESLQKIQSRADAANESFQRSADARSQAGAMKDVALGQVIATKLVEEDKELGKSLDQTGGIKSMLDMSKGGNEVATAAARTRFAEHEIVEGGVKRMNSLEYENLAGSLGSYGRKFTNWVDQGFKGEMPAATNAEMKTILDAEEKVALDAHARNVGYIQNRFLPLATGKAKTVVQSPGNAQGDTVGVQLPGYPPGKIRRASLQKFQQDHPDAPVLP